MKIFLLKNLFVFYSLCFNPRSVMSKPKKSKRFVYNLESLLKVRKIREKQEQEKFQEAEQRVIDEKRKEKELKDQQAFVYQELIELQSKGANMDMGQILRRKAHLDILKVKMGIHFILSITILEHRVQLT